MSIKIAVIGDGGWGTTLSLLLHEKRYDVVLWGAFPDYVKELKAKRMNRKYLPGIPIPKNLKITSNLDEAIDNAEAVILAVPSQFMRSICQKIADNGFPDAIFVSGAKGIENETLMRMSEVIYEVLGDVNLAVISGPNLSLEVAKKMPSAATVSSKNIETARKVQNIFMTDHLRIYTNTDMIGVELGGALKNIIAIAAGIVDGLGMGTNTKSALLTRGLVEITRLGVAMGAKAKTFSGLSGLGDLATTCFSSLSRNHNFGYRIGKGESVDAILKSTEMVIEGVKTSKSAYDLSLKYNVEMPIITEVYKVIYESKAPLEGIKSLMKRPPKSELEEKLE